MVIGNKSLALLSFLLLLLSFGCTSEQVLKPTKTEQVIQTNVVDADNNNIIDYGVYSFSPVSTGSGITTIRTLSVSSGSKVSLVSEQEITDADLLQIDSDFSDFGRDYDDSTSVCLKNIGVKSVRCADARTCLGLCTSNSVKCKNVAQLHGDIVSNSILSYVNDVNEIQDIGSNIRRDIPNLKALGKSRKTDFVSSLYKIMSKIASLNSNPLVSQKELSLCDPVSYDASKLLGIADKIGSHETSDSDYRYTVTLLADFGNLQKNENLKFSDITFSDRLGSSFDVETDSLSVSQPSTVDTSSGSTVLNWQGIRPSSKPKTIVYYSFGSKQPPDAISLKFSAPAATVKTYNFAILTPVVFLYNTLTPITNNFYLSFALSFSIAIIILLTLWTVVIIFYNLLRASLAKEGTATGMRRAFGRTGIRWKSDIVFGIVLLIAGVVSLNGFSSIIPSAPAILKIPEFFSGPDLLLNEPAALAPVLFFFFGFTLVYLAIDNKIKVTSLEAMYGKEMKEDKDMFVAHANQLKTRLEDLKKLIEEYTKENFDVGQEYDVLSSISVEKIDEYIKKADNTSRNIVDDELTRVEESIERLHERKSQADQNWAKWKDAMYKIIDEGGELHYNSLLTIPASLRSWAVQRFLKEYASMGIVMEGNHLKRKEITPDMSIKQMVDKKLLVGAVVSKAGKIVTAKLSKGNATLVGVLTLKLLNYLKSAPRELGQHDFSSVATIGEKYVLVLVRQGIVDSLLVIEKEKFKDAMDEWKSKMKIG